MANSTLESTPAPPKSSSRVTLRGVVAASMAGTVVEWYEFFLYATTARPLFFPKTGNPLEA